MTTHYERLSTLVQHEVAFPTIGKVKVYVQGHLDSHKSIFLTIHDIGTNYLSFKSFLDHPSMKKTVTNSVFLHVCMPGHENSAPTLNESYQYPTLDQFAKELIAVLQNFSLQSVVVIGEGAGANIACRFALAHPNSWLGLILINCTSAAAGVWEHLREKWLKLTMPTHSGVTEDLSDFLISHRYGDESDHNCVYIERYVEQLECLNAVNLVKYIDAFIDRTAITTELPELKNVLLVIGSQVDDVAAIEHMQSKMDKETTDVLVLQNVGNVLAEAPAELAKAFVFFAKQCGILSAISFPGLE